MTSPDPVTNSAEDIFRRIVIGEPWADRIELEVNERWLCPHMAYAPDSGQGLVRMPPHEDPLVVAGWIAHEIGHFEDFQQRRPSSIMAGIEQIIRSRRVPPLIQGLVRKIYYLLFWRERMRREIYAHGAEIRFLRKIGFSLEATTRSDEASDLLTPPMPYYGRLERLFLSRMQKAQDAMTRAARRKEGEERHDC